MYIATPYRTTFCFDHVHRIAIATLRFSIMAASIGIINAVTMVCT